MDIQSLLHFDALCKTVASSLQIGFISFDRTLEVVDSTPSIEHMVYLKPTIDQVLDEGTDTHIWKNWKQLLESALNFGGKAEIGTIKYAFKGQAKLLNISCIPIHDTMMTQVIGGVLVLSDITEELDIEHELAHAERLIAIGKVAGKVAHELNNPLDGILRYVNLSVRTIQSGQPEKACDYLGHCRTGLQRMGQIIAELLDFSRNTHLAFETSPMDKLLEDALRSMEASLQTIEVHLVRDHSRPVPHVKSDALFQVFSNLIKNAADAMQGKGQLTITLRHNADHWEIEFLDTGPGFDPQHADDLFKPFFTTKPKGMGTGLGLAICKDILAKLGGRITAQNAPQGGGQFTLFLPMKNPHLIGKS